VRITRQGFYKARQARQRRDAREEKVLELVRTERAVQPRLGTRKLQVVLREASQAQGIRMGRDRLFALLRKHDLLIRRRRRGRRTTDSRHGFTRHPNRYKDMKVAAPHQAWVGDLTYLETVEGFMYLSLIQDAHSRKIIGYAVEESLTVEGTLRALGQAIRQLPRDCTPVHHSDRGIQYCCHAYQNRLADRGITASMTEEDHCYENAQAERLNGILKQEYGLGERLPSKALARLAAEQAVQLYNTRRPHTALGYRTPAEAHRAPSGAPHETIAASVALRAPSAAIVSSGREKTVN
jgi:putative transposase